MAGIDPPFNARGGQRRQIMTVLRESLGSMILAEVTSGGI
jgi:hypothetical protein